jgi:DNA replication protein DnaC
MITSTLDKLRKMKFFGMFHAFKSSMETGKTNDYTADELLAHLVDAEWDDRQNRRIERQILYAKFCYKASVEDVHYHADRSIDRNQIMRLADCTSLIAMKTYWLRAAPVSVKAMWLLLWATRPVCWVTGCFTPVRLSCLLN